MHPSSQHGRYAAGAFNEELPGGRASGTLSAAGGYLLFESQAASIRLPLSGITVKPGGAGKRLIFFNHPEVPGWTVYTPDRSILTDFQLAHLPGVQQIRRERRRFRLCSAAAAMMVFIAILASAYGVFKLKVPLTRAVAARVPAEWEENLGDMMIAQFKKQQPFIEDEKPLDLLESFFAPLSQNIPDAGYGFALHVVKNPSINAFALPGGDIVLYTGLIHSADSIEELLGVLAHEAAHVTQQHSMRQLIGSAGVFILVQAFFGDVSGLLAVIVENSEWLINLKYSRDYEREADDTGWQYLMAADIDPRGMITFFEKLNARQPDRDLPVGLKKRLEFLSTHPTTDERIARLKQKAAELSGKTHFRRFEIDVDQLKQCLPDNGGSAAELLP
ncbi:MAG: M48 family metallopeptidase [Desulfobacterales bacterium]|nr:M48 family metallopeptidase [Desulfobacterales bacterium]